MLADFRGCNVKIGIEMMNVLLIKLSSFQTYMYIAIGCPALVYYKRVPLYYIHMWVYMSLKV